jgi:plasmid stabilization system protein ParE
MKLFQIHRLARAEWEKAIAYYDKQQAGLGREFQAEVEDTLGRILLNPGIGAPCEDKGYRSMLVHRFPFLVVYLETDVAISVMAIAHERRRPRYWSRRKME